MTDTGVCVGCGAGGDGDEVELNELGMCADCDLEKTPDGEDKLDMGLDEDA